MSMTEEQYLITCLGEEASEVAEIAARIAVRASKAARFGLTEQQPGQLLTNQDRIQVELENLKSELRDLLSVARMLGFDVEVWPAALEAKRKKIEKYMAYSREIGQVGSRIQ